MQVLLQYQSKSYYIIGQEVYYIIWQLLHYRAFFITLSGSYYSIGRLLHYRLVQREQKMHQELQTNTVSPKLFIAILERLFRRLNWETKNDSIISALLMTYSYAQKHHNNYKKRRQGRQAKRWRDDLDKYRRNTMIDLAEKSAIQANLDGACRGFHPTTGHYGCPMTMMMLLECY